MNAKQKDIRTPEELTERYGDCCEVSYALIEKDKQIAIKEAKREVFDDIEKDIRKFPHLWQDHIFDGILKLKEKHLGDKK